MELRVETDARTTTVDVTDRVADAISPDCDTGTCTVFVEHTTAALAIQENEPRLREDIEGFLADLVPDEGHAHDRLDNNADAHLRATILGPSVSVPIRDGSLALGTWQSILLVECDGPRTRRLSLTVLEG
ncbi:secondary thiamine-phosphate synthase enzyme YjbQ [Halovivax limisalsi]|uniref:secondary thiamine-phosphate synthase enzyme YjbQ n=1 Tax=Halovivax limisalsi TaxID=1453760 RepID=UPI001FFC9901|nr:secondary thiamine-phosphate synthase enzyme YjbQ [Halovivax limisalsi]